MAAGAAGEPEQGRAGQFDYDTISDVILHIRYTAREGGGLLRKGATGQLEGAPGGRGGVSSVRLFSLRHEFPTAWAAYKAAAAVDGVRPLKITLTEQHYPFWSQSVADKQVLSAKLIVPGAVKVAKPDGSNPAEAGPFFGEMRIVNLTGDLKPAFAGDWAVGLGADGANDAWLAVQWGAPG